MESQNSILIKDMKTNDSVKADAIKGAEKKTDEISTEENKKHYINGTPIVCNCDIVFETKLDKSRHIRIFHKNYFNCDNCKKGVFRHEADYLKHISVKHKHLRRKSNTCDVCSYEALNRRKLREHKIYTHDKRVFQCDVCSMEITGKVHFSSHGRKHEKPTDCKECGKTIRKGKMGLHIKTVHVRDEFDCLI